MTQKPFIFIIITGEFLLFMNVPKSDSIARRCSEQEISYWVKRNSFYATLVVPCQCALWINHSL